MNLKLKTANKNVPKNSKRPVTRNLAKNKMEVRSLDSLLLNWKTFKPLQTPEYKCFENLSANLLSKNTDKKYQIILMTATNSGEGTSTIAIHSAATLANDFQFKVLLIDLNYRFSNYSNQEKPNHFNTEECFESKAAFNLNKIEVGNLSILTFNGSFLDPIENLANNEFDDFLKRQREIYDYVILDAPPIKRSSVARILSSKADGVIMVVEAHKTRKHVALRARDTLQKAGAHIIGAVINKRKLYIPDFIYKFL